MEYMDAQMQNRYEAHEERMEEGDICCLCGKSFVETYGRPLACEDCGGDGVLATYENQHQGY